MNSLLTYVWKLNLKLNAVMKKGYAWWFDHTHNVSKLIKLNECIKLVPYYFRYS